MADGGKLVRQLLDRSFVRIGACDVLVFVEPGQRLRFAAANGERAIAHHPFGVDEMADDLAHAPFARRVSIELVVQRDAVGERVQLGGLRFERRQGSVSGTRAM